MVELWLLGTAIVFTIFGFVTGKLHQLDNLTGAVIETLIIQGYLRTRVNKNGETEIVKLNDKK